MQPRLLILDEPTGGLDWRSQSELMQVVTSYRDQGCSVVLITHDMRLVAEHTKRAVVLLEGRVLYDGSARELFARPDVLQVAGLTSPPVTRLAARLRRAGMDPILSNDEFVARWLARPISQRARGRVGEAARRRWALRNAKGRAQ